MEDAKPKLTAADKEARRKLAIRKVTVSPTRRRLDFSFATSVDGSFSADKVVAFLRDLLK